MCLKLASFTHLYTYCTNSSLFVTRLFLHVIASSSKSGDPILQLLAALQQTRTKEPTDIHSYSLQRLFFCSPLRFYTTLIQSR